jgi:hypothetical protein
MRTGAKRPLLLSALFVFFAISSGTSFAEVNVNIGVFAPPPPVVIESPPVMAVVVGTPYVYYAPAVPVGLFFYYGNWYRPHEGHWFRARSYRGPWAHIPPGRVPAALAKIPPDYRTMSPGHQRIPYGQMNKHWKTWERDRRWGGGAARHSGFSANYQRSKPRTGNASHRGRHGGPGH